jgi:transglutaminase-like putative cysteine protease
LFRTSSEELETHAWVEAFVPSVGWLGLDPTHGEVATDTHIAVAMGRSYADVPPNRGVYRGGAEERIDVSVRIQRIELNADLGPLSVGRPDAHLLTDHVTRERRLDLHALEQQRQQQQQQQQ